MSAAGEDGSFEALIAYIRDNRAFDFTGYKSPSLKRRVGRRMQAVGIETYEEYRDLLEQRPDEFVELFNTILINVTGFFRDLAAWEYLQAEIVPRVVESVRRDEPIRAWSAGCASGEESYTLAIILAEAIGRDELRERVKIYATDVDQDALRQARQARYSRRDVASVPERLAKEYFEPLDHQLVVAADIRRSIIFGRNDLVQDPPISRVDLLVARNTLMYLGPAAQKRILSNFHSALNPTGFLFLGKSEAQLTRSRLFSPVDVRMRVFTKRGLGEFVERAPRLSAQAGLRHEGSDEASAAAFDAAPVAGIVIDSAGTMVRANQQARRGLSLADSDVGRPFRDLAVSYRPLELRSPIERAHAERRPVTVRDVSTPDGESRLDAEIVPLPGADGATLGVCVWFAEVGHLHRLEQELDQTKRELESAYEELRSTVKELETTNEELQSTNEELETTNEELQSTNEELETMNEELQSTNEELETINDELRLRTEESQRATVFLESVLAGIRAAVVVLDAGLRVRAWSVRAEDLWGLRADEAAGRHFLELEFGLPVVELRDELRASLDPGGEGVSARVSARTRLGREIACIVTASPLLTPAGAADGVILLMEEER